MNSVSPRRSFVERLPPGLVVFVFVAGGLYLFAWPLVSKGGVYQGKQYELTVTRSDHWDSRLIVDGWRHHALEEVFEGEFPDFTFKSQVGQKELLRVEKVGKPANADAYQVIDTENKRVLDTLFRK